MGGIRPYPGVLPADKRLKTDYFSAAKIYLRLVVNNQTVRCRKGSPQVCFDFKPGNSTGPNSRIDNRYPRFS
jgi:hypothetical protein